MLLGHGSCIFVWHDLMMLTCRLSLTMFTAGCWLVAFSESEQSTSAYLTLRLGIQVEVDYQGGGSYKRKYRVRELIPKGPFDLMFKNEQVCNSACRLPLFVNFRQEDVYIVLLSMSKCASKICRCAYNEVSCDDLGWFPDLRPLSAVLQSCHVHSTQSALLNTLIGLQDPFFATAQLHGPCSMLQKHVCAIV